MLQYTQLTPVLKNFARLMTKVLNSSQRILSFSICVIGKCLNGHTTSREPLSKHKCVECGEERNTFMHIVSKLETNEEGQETTTKELWCFSCVFKQTLVEYNATQKKLHRAVRDTRFMSKSDKENYGVKIGLN